MEAVQLVQTSKKPLAQIARDLGIADSTLHHWRKLFSEQGEQAFPDSGHQTPHEEELRHLKRENELLRQERDVLKKLSAFFARPAVKFQFVAEHSHKYSITLLCQALEVSESGYSAWKNRKVSQHCREDARLSAIHAVSIGLSSDMLKSKKERQEILKGSTFGKMYNGVCKVTNQELTLI